MISEYNLQTSSFLLQVSMLEKIGFKSQFQAQESGIRSLTTQRVYQPQEVNIINKWQFDERPAQQQACILYALESNNGERGILIDFIGSDHDQRVSDFIRQLEGLRRENRYR